MLFLEEDAMQDFKDIDTSNPNAVVIGLAPSMFHYDKLTEAFNCLQSGAQLIGLNKSRYFQRETGLSLGPGAFVSALEYSTDKSAKIIGKPSKTFFEKSIESLEDVALEDCVMIGDDVRDDVGGAQCIGMRGILVQTGKYRDGDEMKVSPPPYMVLPSLVDAIDHLVSLKATSA
ncbi:haloacid dehalogenase-like hydrolase domain-containing protein 2 isoform X2 [Watersipora subatra]